jgi:hypothetical protein
MTIPGFTAESALYNNSEHKRILGTPPPAVMSWAIQPARTFVREPEKDGQGQFGVEVGDQRLRWEDVGMAIGVGRGVDLATPLII